MNTAVLLQNNSALAHVYQVSALQIKVDTSELNENNLIFLMKSEAGSC